MWSYIIFAIILFFILCFIGTCLSVLLQEPEAGIIAVVVGIIVYWLGSHIVGIIIGIIGIACYIHVKSENSPEKIKERRFPPVHLTLSSTGSYSSILNNCEQIVWSIAKRCPWLEFHVYVMVHKINSTNCSVSFSIGDVSFKNYNITFVNEFEINQWGTARFETEQATGFTTSQDAMRELNLQFNWHDVSTHITESKIYDFGDYKNNPLIVLGFDAKYKE